MAATYTLDASVVVSAVRNEEPGHAESRQLMDRLRESATPVIVPTLLLPEAAAALRRVTGDAALAERFVAALQRLPNVVWVAVDSVLARQAAELAGEHALRGSDAVYAAVARRFGSTLVTLDQQQLERSAGAIETRGPDEAIQSIGQ